MAVDYQMTAQAWAERAVNHDNRIDHLESGLRHIRVLAKDGQDHSASWALDRLLVIEEMCDRLLKK